MPVLQPPVRISSPTHASSGARLISSTGKALPLRSISLDSEAAGGVARTRLRQHFANPYSEPLELAYSFPLPADGTVAAYQMRAGDRVVEGRVEKREEARANFDAARLQGRTAALLDQERPNLFTQRLGNIPAGTDVIIELTVDHMLGWRPGAWEWRFPTVVAPRYLGGAGVVPDAERVTVDLADRPTSPTASVTVRIADDLPTAPTSATHGVVVDGQVVTLADNAGLDRDIVISWNAHRQAPGCHIRALRAASPAAAAGGSAYGLLTIVPPSTQAQSLSRDLILLLDVSGSMSGQPIARLKNVVTGLIETLGDEDQLEMIAFSSSPRRYRSAPVRAAALEREKACAWVNALTADGGTEMIGAIAEALRPVRRDIPRQVVIVTDGLIGFESSAIRAIRDGLPTSSRLHTVGVGSAANRAFLRPAARAGRGVEVLIDLDEAAALGTERIVAATRAPMLVDVAIEGTALEDGDRKLSDLLAGSPLVSPLRLKPAGGSLVVRGRTSEGAWEQRLDVKPEAPADDLGTVRAAIPVLWARQAIEDLELDLACDGPRAEIDRQIEAIALDHSVSSRLTSWIAIACEPVVDPRDPVRVERIPQTLPYGMSDEGPFLSALASRTAIVGMVPMFAKFELDALELSADGSAPAAPAAPEAPEAPERLMRRLSKTLREKMPSLRRQVGLRGRGRILVTPGRPTTTLEVIVESGCDWQAPKTIRIGDRSVEVLESGTTKPGPIKGGTLVRVELAVAPDEIRGQGPVEIQCGARILLVTLDLD